MSTSIPLNPSGAFTDPALTDIQPSVISNVRTGKFKNSKSREGKSSNISFERFIFKPKSRICFKNLEQYEQSYKISDPSPVLKTAKVIKCNTAVSVRSPATKPDTNKK